MHVARKKSKQETKTNKRQCHEGPTGSRSMKAVQKESVWSERLREWIDGESEGGDCDEVNQEESEQNEVDGMKKEADSTGEVMHI